jgi:hypothetical protein
MNLQETVWEEVEWFKIRVEWRASVNPAINLRDIYKRRISIKFSVKTPYNEN